MSTKHSFHLSSRKKNLNSAFDLWTKMLHTCEVDLNTKLMEKRREKQEGKRFSVLNTIGT